MNNVIHKSRNDKQTSFFKRLVHLTSLDSGIHGYRILGTTGIPYSAPRRCASDGPSWARRQLPCQGSWVIWDSSARQNTNFAIPVRWQYLAPRAEPSCSQITLLSVFKDFVFGGVALSHNQIRHGFHVVRSRVLMYIISRIAVAPGLGWCPPWVSWVIEMPFLSRLSTDSVRWFDICRCLVVVPVASDGIRRDFTADFDDSATRIKKNWKVPFQDWS